MEKDERELLSALECAESYLSEDITAIGYFQDEYFAFTEPQESFKYKYREMQNTLSIIFRSMIHNRDMMRTVIDEEFKVRKNKKEVNM